MSGKQDGDKQRDPYSHDIDREIRSFQRRIAPIKRSPLIPEIEALIDKLHSEFKQAALAHYEKYGLEGATGWGGLHEDVDSRANYVATSLVDSCIALYRWGR